MKKSFFVSAFLPFIGLVFSLSASVKLPHLFQDGVVLQRGEHTQIWGNADPSAGVMLEFCGETYDTVADSSGKWTLLFENLEAGGPFVLRIEADDGSEIELKDVYVGDVWLCSGQSNMELTMDSLKYRFPEEVADSENREIRQFEVADRFDFKTPQHDLESGSWTSADPESVLQFSAVGYFFAKHIFESEGVPIGLLNASLGGSPVQSWMSEAALKKFPDDLAEGKRWANDGLIESTRKSDQDKSNAWFSKLTEADPGVSGSEYLWANPETDTSDWVEVTLPDFYSAQGLEDEPGVVWLRKEFDLTTADLTSDRIQLWLGRIVDADKTFLNGHFVGEVTYQYPARIYDVSKDFLKEGKNVLVVRVVVNGKGGKFFTDKPYYVKTDELNICLEGKWIAKQVTVQENAPRQTFIRWKPLGLYNGMIAPLTSFAIKGVIWYQGESNIGNPEHYQDMFETMVKDWRKNWTNLDDFPFLTVQLANLGKPLEQPSDDNWALLREQQYAATRIPNSGMAITYDVGEWNDIHPLDKKTVGIRLARCAENIAYGHEDVVYRGPEYLRHTIEGDRVRVEFKYIANGLRLLEGDSLGGFAICGEDDVFHWAKARVDGNTVVLSSNHVPHPTEVRYAWAQNPSNANLYNSELLPAVPFRTDKNKH